MTPDGPDLSEEEREYLECEAVDAWNRVAQVVIPSVLLAMNLWFWVLPPGLVLAAVVAVRRRRAYQQTATEIRVRSARRAAGESVEELPKEVPGGFAFAVVVVAAILSISWGIRHGNTAAIVGGGAVVVGALLFARWGDRLIRRAYPTDERP